MSILDKRNIFIIFGRGWKKATVERELIDEGYNHWFYFEMGQDWDELVNHLKFSDEVWIFGDVREYDSYKYAVENGMDIWVMG